MEKKSDIYKLRHSAAHLLAQAVKHLYPNALPTIGPVTEHGFFYDFKLSQPLKEEDLKLIEATMREFSSKNYPIVGEQVEKKIAKTIFANNPFKLEIIDQQIDGETAGVYTQGDFIDLCSGGHTESTGAIKYFSLTAISGSYWRADRNGTPLTRISGIAFLSQEDMDTYLDQQKEAKMRDHRLLGKTLDLFSFNDVAPGSVFFHPYGTILFESLVSFIRKSRDELDYTEVKTPSIMEESLWITSGHAENYRSNMYFTAIDERAFAIKPMNCPGAILLYNQRPRSYRELPLRLSEFGVVHRNESSGTLHGLMRLRTFTQDDSHTFCTAKQIKAEVKKIIKLVETIYKKLGFEKIQFAVATRPEKAIGSEELWTEAINDLQGALSELKMPYEIHEGDGAFYGPKISVYIEDSMGRKWQCGTTQIDFFMPERFELSYIESNQARHTPVIIHNAILGSIERFCGILLEHLGGKLPFWLSPVQVKILTITDAQDEYGKQIFNFFKNAGLRVEIDSETDKISAKIRRAQISKTPIMIILGKIEASNQTLSVRYLDGKSNNNITKEDFLAQIHTINTNADGNSF